MSLNFLKHYYVLYQANLFSISFRIQILTRFIYYYYTILDSIYSLCQIGDFLTKISHLNFLTSTLELTTYDLDSRKHSQNTKPWQNFYNFINTKSTIKNYSQQFFKEIMQNSLNNLRAQFAYKNNFAFKQNLTCSLKKKLTNN